MKFTRTIHAPAPQTKPGSKVGVRGKKRSNSTPNPTSQNANDRKSKFRPTN